MGLPDNVLGSDSSSAVPGGNVTKPLMIALFALLASRYMSGGSKEAPVSARPDPAPTSPTSLPDASPGDVLGGLGGLLKQFQQSGFATFPPGTAELESEPKMLSGNPIVNSY